MKINFSKKTLFLIVGFLIVIGFFWIGYKPIQNEELNETNSQEMVISYERSLTYPFNIIEGEVLSVSEEGIKLKADLSQMYSEGGSSTKEIEIIINSGTNLISKSLQGGEEIPVTIEDFSPNLLNGPIVIKIRESNEDITSRNVFTAVEVIKFVE